MRLGVTDELTSEFPQPHHVKTSCEFNVLKKLRNLGRYNNVHRISIGGGGGHWIEWRKYIGNVTFLIYNKNCYFDIYSPKAKIVVSNVT